MAKTIDITKLATLSESSVSVLGKNGSNKLGFIDNDVLKGIDATYTPESTRPQAGTAVAEAIKPLATKEEVGELDTELKTKASTEDLEEKVSEINTKLDEKATKTELQSKETELSGKITTLEESKATKEELAQKATEINTEVEKKATKDALAALQTQVNQKVVQELEGTNSGDKAKIQNQTNGAVIQYVSSDQSNSAITVNDYSQNVGAEICSLDAQGQGSRIVANKQGAYYSVGNSISVAAGDEIATKKDVDAKVSIHNDKDNNQSYLANEDDGAIMKFIRGTDKFYSKVGLGNDETRGAVLQLVVAKDGEGTNDTDIVKLEGTKTGMFYAKHGGVCAETEEIATKADVNKKIDILIEHDGNQSYMNNEKDGGIIKYIKPDETFSKITLCDSGDPNPILLQLAVKEGDKAKTKNGDAKLVKINGSVNGFFYVKGEGNEEKADNELAVKGDLKTFSPAELEGLETGHKATCHNSPDGGSLKYEAGEAGTAFIGVNYDTGKKGLLAEFAVTGQKQGTTLKSGKRLLAKTSGIFYTKEREDLTTPAETEVATLGDVEKRVLGEIKTEDKGTAIISNDKTGGILKWVDKDNQTTAGVCVNDGANDIYAQLYVKTQDEAGSIQENGKKHTSVRLNVGLEGIYYIKDKAVGTQHTEDEELVTKADLKALKTELEQAKAENAQLKSQVEQLQKSYTEAISQVNDYTANVKTLLDQSSPADS